MNQFLIANAQRCIGCRTCEVACAVAHQQAQDVAALSTNHFAPRIRVVKSGDILDGDGLSAVRGCALRQRLPTGGDSARQ